LAGRATRAPSRFTKTIAAFKQRTKTMRRLERRAATLLQHRDAAEVPEARKLLAAIVEHGDVIALPADDAKRIGRPDVHILLSLPARIADELAAFTGRFEDDEDTDGGEDGQDLEPGEDDEFSLGIPDAFVDQSRRFPGTIVVGDKWQSIDNDLEADPTEH
jgi:hypothetical protein